MRDRAILETFYSTGIRRTELLKLKLPEIDRSNELVTVREGKGRKDREWCRSESGPWLGWINILTRSARNW